jgi:hypothetical protein
MDAFRSNYRLQLDDLLLYAVPKNAGLLMNGMADGCEIGKAFMTVRVDETRVSTLVFSAKGPFAVCGSLERQNENM